MTRKKELLVNGNDIEAPPAPTPVYGSLEWPDYVVSLLDPVKEFDNKGNPLTDGLRRIVLQALGPIIAIRPLQVFEANESNQYRCTCAVEVQIDFSARGDRSDIRIFSDLADIYPGNSGQYAQHAACTAFTRAEGRAYRKALLLPKIYAAEEMSDVPPGDSGATGFITLNQKVTMNKMCRELDINLEKFISSGRVKYSHIDQIRLDKAHEMMDTINSYQQEMSRIPEGIRGYDQNFKLR